MLRSRTTRTLFLAGILIVLAGLVRPLPASFEIAAQSRFFAQKMLWSDDHDIVFAGDSRTYIGIAPAMVMDSLPQDRIANFGFSGCAFSARYLRAAERLLDRTSRSKAIVLGITAQSLTPEAARANKFLELSKIPRVDLYLVAHSTTLQRLFAPYNLWEIAATVRGETTDKGGRADLGHLSYQHQDDGWCAVRRVSGGPNADRLAAEKTLAQYAELFEKSRVSRAMVAKLLAKVRAWRSRGIRVYGFRPPTSPAMARLEREVGGFDEGAFVPRFERAGGTWLRVDPKTYASYDGSHLSAEAALQFSADLGRQLQAELAGRSDAGRHATGDVRRTLGG